MKVKVRGCVASPGDFEFGETATLQDAIDAAMGYGGQQMQPTGIISIRRKTSGSVEGLSFNYKISPNDMKTLLHDRDTIIVQFDVESRKPD